jgi:hypothetical protein
MSVNPSRRSTRTASPTSAPASQRARQSSPLIRTCPSGRHRVTTSARAPIIASAPVAGRHLRAIRKPQVSSPASIARPPRITSRFHGHGKKNSANRIATVSATEEPSQAAVPFAPSPRSSVEEQRFPKPRAQVRFLPGACRRRSDQIGSGEVRTGHESLRVQGFCDAPTSRSPSPRRVAVGLHFGALSHGFETGPGRVSGLPQHRARAVTMGSRWATPSLPGPGRLQRRGAMFMHSGHSMPISARAARLNASAASVASSAALSAAATAAAPTFSSKPCLRTSSSSSSHGAGDVSGPRDIEGMPRTAQVTDPSGNHIGLYQG